MLHSPAINFNEKGRSGALLPFGFYALSYELHDFFLYYTLRHGFRPSKIYDLACKAFDGSNSRVCNYDDLTIKKWITIFFKRFFTQQFKRSCLPDGPKTGSCSLSPRGDWCMPTDAMPTLWLEECNQL